jgi:hypothetical protein
LTKPAARPDRRCPDTHPHNETCYSRHGCRDAKCLAWRREAYRQSADYERLTRRLQGRNVCVPAAPTARKLRALACIGWSAAEIAARTGFSEIHVSRVRRGITGETVSVQFEGAVRDVYEALSMTVRDTHHGRKTMSVARRNGWRAPLDWDEGEINAA